MNRILEILRERLYRSQAQDLQKLEAAKTSEGIFIIDPDDSIIGKYLKQGAWELFETNWMKSVLKPGDCMIDAGANLGWYTVAAARQVGPGGSVLAFEPDPHNFCLLELNVKENRVKRQSRLFNFALLDRSGSCTLELARDNLGDHRVRFRDLDKCGAHCFGEDKRSVIKVRCQSIDDTLSELRLKNKRIRLLKMDTQGSEIHILKGAAQTLLHTDYLLMEYWPYVMDRAGCSPEDFLNCVEDCFSEFTRVEDPLPPFRSISQLKSDLTKPMSMHTGTDAYTMYILRKAGVD